MWVRLNTVKQIDVAGKKHIHYPGDWVEIGRQDAWNWIRAGDACAPSARPQTTAVDSDTFKQTDTGTTGFTVFAIPRGFEGIYKIRQENALRSWCLFKPKPEIILFGDDPHVKEYAKKYGCRHIPKIERNGWGTPRVDDIFLKAQRVAKYDLMTYINADIILFQAFADSLITCGSKFGDFLMISKRWDCDILEPLGFGKGWEEELAQRVRGTGRAHSAGALDYFGFWRGCYISIPPFGVGRSAWDNYLVCNAVYRGVDVVENCDGMAIHQDMPRVKKRRPRRNVPKDAEKLRNWELYAPERKGISGSANNAKWELRNGVFKPHRINVRPKGKRRPKRRRAAVAE